MRAGEITIEEYRSDRIPAVDEWRDTHKAYIEALYDRQNYVDAGWDMSDEPLPVQPPAFSAPKSAELSVNLTPESDVNPFKDYQGRYTKKGMPFSRDLSKHLGRKISAKERDRLWNTYQS